MSGSFPLLEHVALLRATLPTPASPQCKNTCAWAALEPLAVLSTPPNVPATASASASASASAMALLDEEPALRAELCSFVSSVLRQQQQQRCSCRKVAQLYADVETALSLQDGDVASMEDSLSRSVSHSLNSFSVAPADTAASRTQSFASPLATTPRSAGVLSRKSLSALALSSPAAAARRRAHAVVADDCYEAESTLATARLAEGGTGAGRGAVDGAPRVNPWSTQPVAREGVYIQVPRRGLINACRRWHVNASASDAAASAATCPSSSSPDACAMRYADAQHYYATAVASQARSSSDSAPRQRNDEGFLYGYAVCLGGSAFFPSADSVTDASADHGEAARGAREVEEQALVLCVTSTSPTYNFMRAVAVETLQRLCNAAHRAAAAAAAVAVAATDSSSLLLAHLLNVLEPLREFTDPCSASSQTPPGRPIALPFPRGSSGQAAGDGWRVSRPCDMLYPHLDAPLAMLLLSFPPDALRVLHALLLQESRVIIVGATAQHASACVVAAPALVAPMTWAAPLLPYVDAELLTGSGLLDTLLAPSVGLLASRRQARRQRRAPPQSATALPECNGFLMGACAELVPQLMLRLSAVAAAVKRQEEAATIDPGAGGDTGVVGATTGAGGLYDGEGRVWLADARTGSIGVVPVDPLAPLFSHVASGQFPKLPSYAVGGSLSGAESNSYHGDDAFTDGASQRTPHAHDRRAKSSSAAAAAAPPAVTFPFRTEAQRRALRHATSHNAALVSSFAVLEVLPAHDKLKAALKRAVSAEQRLSFRLALEAMTALEADRRATKLEEQERLQELLALVRSASAAVLDGESATTDSEGERERGASVDPSDSSASSGSDDYSDEVVDELDGTRTTPTRAHTGPQGPSMNATIPLGSVSSTHSRQSPSSTLPAAGLSSSFAHPNMADSFTASSLELTGGGVALAAAGLPQSGANNGGDGDGGGDPPLLPVLSSAALVEVHAALLDVNVQRVLGSFRRGLLFSQSRVTGINLALFLPASLGNSYRLAEALGRTHMYRQFEQSLLCAETLGMRRVLRGDYVLRSLTSTSTSASASAVSAGDARVACNYYVSHPRMVALLNLFIERSRRRFSDLFPNVFSGLAGISSSKSQQDAGEGVANALRVAMAATTAGTHAPSTVSVPAVSFIAGMENVNLYAAADYHSSSGGGGGAAGAGVAMPPLAPSPSSASGGGGGGVKKFFAKVKHSLSGGGGGGGGDSSSSTSHTATVPIGAFVQSPNSFSGGDSGTATRVQLLALSQRTRRRTDRRLKKLAAASRRAEARREKKSEKSKDAATREGRGLRNRGRRRHRHHHRSHSPMWGDAAAVAAVVSAAADGGNRSRPSHASLRLQVQTAIACALQQQDCLAREFTMPDALSANDQSLIASAAAAAAGGDGVALLASGPGGHTIAASASSGANSSSSNSNAGGGTGGKSYVSGMGVENELMRQIALRGGGSSGGGPMGATTEYPGLTGALGPVLCRALPLDAVHHFDKYHPLLSGNSEGGGCWSTVSYDSPMLEGVLYSTAAAPRLPFSVTPERASLYTTLGSLCPSSAAVWRCAERLTGMSLLLPQQPQPQQQQKKKEKPLSVSAATPPSPPLAPAAAATAAVHPPPPQRSVFDELFDDAPVATRQTTSLPVANAGAVRADCAGAASLFTVPSPAPTAGGGAGAPSAFVAHPLPFSPDLISGPVRVPPRDSPPSAASTWGAFSSGIPEGYAPVQGSAANAASRPLPPASSSAASVTPTQNATQRLARETTMPAPSGWDVWGLQAPATTTTTRSSPAVARDSPAAFSPPSSTASSPFGGLSRAATTSVLSSATATATAPAPGTGSVMDELFSFAAPPPPAGGSSGQPRTFDDFFR